MVKNIIRKLFFKVYKLDSESCNERNSYNRYGMVIPKSHRNVRYIATPVSINRKTFRKSIVRYGISSQDSGKEAIKKAILVRLDDFEEDNNYLYSQQCHLKQNDSKQIVKRRTV